MSNDKHLNEDDIFNMFGADFDRFDFPADVYRVTAGSGGEALLILGSEKTALLDCGMAYCGKAMVDNVKTELAKHQRTTLDFIVLSHSHYDHMGALPYVKAEFPKAAVCASKKCSEILKRPNARKLMKELGTAARDLYAPQSREEIIVDPLNVDMILEDGDVLSLGKESLVALETKGHTDCSMSYALEPYRLLFSSESTGMLESIKYVHTPILKDYEDSLRSAEKCRAYRADYLCLPHLGMIPNEFNEKYWDMFEAACREKLEFIKGMREDKLDEEAMVSEYIKKYWNPAIEQVQPKEAYAINARAIVKAILKAI